MDLFKVNNKYKKYAYVFLRRCLENSYLQVFNLSLIYIAMIML